MLYGVRNEVQNLKYGVQLSCRRKTHEDWNAFKEAALACEELGYDSVWLADHVYGTRFEGWTFLAALSGITTKLRLGTLVLCNNFRNPALLAKMGATLDVISNGRLELGLGAGWNLEEHDAYGLYFPRFRERIERVDEAITIIKKMWTEDTPSYAGRYYQIREAPCDPKPVQKPHPPITIGGGGEKYTLRVVAAHADRWSYPRGNLTIFKRKLDVLKTHCLGLGRNPDEIDMTFYSHDTHVYDNEEELVKTLKNVGNTPRPRRGRHVTFEEYLNQTKQNSVIGTVEECRTKIKEIRALGINHVIFRFTQPESLEQIRRFTEEVIKRS